MMETLSKLEAYLLKAGSEVELIRQKLTRKKTEERVKRELQQRNKELKESEESISNRIEEIEKAKQKLKKLKKLSNAVKEKQAVEKGMKWIEKFLSLLEQEESTFPSADKLIGNGGVNTNKSPNQPTEPTQPTAANEVPDIGDNGKMKLGKREPESRVKSEKITNSNETIRNESRILNTSSTKRIAKETNASLATGSSSSTSSESKKIHTDTSNERSLKRKRDSASSPESQAVSSSSTRSDDTGNSSRKIEKMDIDSRRSFSSDAGVKVATQSPSTENFLGTKSVPDSIAHQSKDLSQKQSISEPNSESNTTDTEKQKVPVSNGLTTVGEKKSVEESSVPLRSSKEDPPLNQREKINENGSESLSDSSAIPAQSNSESKETLDEVKMDISTSSPQPSPAESTTAQRSRCVGEDVVFIPPSCWWIERLLVEIPSRVLGEEVNIQVPKNAEKFRVGFRNIPDCLACFVADHCLMSCSDLDECIKYLTDCKLKPNIQKI